jgi:hypothetical protein
MSGSRDTRKGKGMTVPAYGVRVGDFLVIEGRDRAMLVMRIEADRTHVRFNGIVDIAREERVTVR